MRKGFTLIEVLVVILIIAVLAAFALPQYQLVIDQSRWSTMLPTAKAIKDAQERAYMQGSTYATEAHSLDLAVSENMQDNEIIAGEVVYTLEKGTGNDPSYNAVVAVHELLFDNKLMMYLSYSANFPEQIHCLAVTTNRRANRLCQSMAKATLGEEGDYTFYLVE